MTITTYRYSLPSENGEGWAIIFLDSSGSFSALSDWGNYGYRWSNWGAGGMDFRAWLAGRGDDYLLGKLAPEEIYDGVATDRAIRQTIMSERRHRRLTKEEARREWEILGSHDIEVDEQEFWNWAAATELADAQEFVACRPSPVAVSFIKRVMPRLRVKMLEDMKTSETVGDLTGPGPATCPSCEAEPCQCLVFPEPTRTVIRMVKKEKYDAKVAELETLLRGVVDSLPRSGEVWNITHGVRLAISYLVDLDEKTSNADRVGSSAHALLELGPGPSRDAVMIGEPYSDEELAAIDCDRCWEIDRVGTYVAMTIWRLTATAQKARAEVERLKALINTPELASFTAGSETFFIHLHATRRPMTCFACAIGIPADCGSIVDGDAEVFPLGARLVYYAGASPVTPGRGGRSESGRGHGRRGRPDSHHRGGLMATKRTPRPAVVPPPPICDRHGPVDEGGCRGCERSFRRIMIALVSVWAVALSFWLGLLGAAFLDSVRRMP